MAEINSILDTGTLYHDLLFSYQRAQKLYHGPRGSSYVLQSAEDFLLRIEAHGKLDLTNSESFEHAIKKMEDILKQGRIVKSLTVEEQDQDQYVLRVEGCIFAGRVHKLANTKDVTCPFGVIAMALYNKFKGKAPLERESLYSDFGTQTIIEAAP